MPATKLEQARAGLEHSLGIQEPLRDRAASRMRARHAGQKKAERQAASAHDRADRLLKRGQKQKANAVSHNARKLERKAGNEEDRAIFWKGRARILTQRIDGISTRLEDIEAHIAQWEKNHKPHVSPSNPNKIIGADDKGEAFIYAAHLSVRNCTERTRLNHYSMSGSGFDVKHTIEPGPSYSERDDCSLYVTGLCWSAGLPDPNGEKFGGGYTGTLLGQHNGWRLCTITELRRKGWGLVVYGSGDGHHTEAYIGEGKTDLTAGHGSAPVDHGSIHLFGSGEVERYLIFDPS